MTFQEIVTLISNAGATIAALAGLAFFTWKMYEDMKDMRKEYQSIEEKRNQDTNEKIDKLVETVEKLIDELGKERGK